MEIITESQYCIKCRRPTIADRTTCNECKKAFAEWEKQKKIKREPSSLEFFIAEEFKLKAIDYVLHNKGALLSFNEIKVFIESSFLGEHLIKIVFPYYQLFRESNKMINSDSDYGTIQYKKNYIYFIESLPAQLFEIDDISEKGIYNAILKIKPINEI